MRRPGRGRVKRHTGRGMVQKPPNPRPQNDQRKRQPQDEQRIQIGLRDAVNNLRKLEAGNRRNG